MSQFKKDSKCTQTNHISKELIKTKKVNYCICITCNKRVESCNLETVTICCDNPEYIMMFLTKSRFGN